VKDLENAIFSIQSEEAFNAVALEVFEFQSKNNPIYSDFLSHIRSKKPTHYTEIQCLPISFFKTHAVSSVQGKAEVTFLSSGTTGMIRSKHLVYSTEMYRRSFEAIYEMQIGKPEHQVILALLPNYIQQGNSSLVFMVDALIKQTKSPLSGFILDEMESLSDRVKIANETGKEVVVFGVSYALLDAAEMGINLSSARIIETGGMKGRRKELFKEALHAELKKGFQVPFISSEYGMTELLSQSYSNADGLFDMPPWMRFQIRETTDPFSFEAYGKTGGVNVIDLANLYSCSFISTQDLGKNVNGQLQLMGRFDHADVRGCNLLVG
jgi:hypothetical protein